MAVVDAHMGLDGPVVVERQLGPDESVGELAGVDLQGLHVSGDLLVAGHEADLEGAGTLLVLAATDEHDHVRGHRHRRR